MSRTVPSAAATLRILRYLSGQPGPVPAVRIAAAVGLPRSTAYRLLATMAGEEFVVHYPEDRTWGVGTAAWEVGTSFTVQAPLARLGRLPLARLVDQVGQSAHLAILHGRDILYLVEERAPGRPPLVSDVGVRLPSHLTASGRAILSTLSPAQVRALYPGPESFTSRTDQGPASPSALREVLSATRRRGYAREENEVTQGFVSIAVPIPSLTVQASVAITWDARPDRPAAPFVRAASATAATIGRRLGGPRGDDR